MTVEELNVIVRANQDDFDRKIRMVNENLVNVKKQAEDTSAGTLSAFKTLASGLSALGIGAMIKNAISLAGDLQQNIGGSESVFKNYAGTIQRTAETAASSLGLSQSKYLATATKMGALFQGSGFSVAQFADMVTQSMQRASDVASIMGISVDSAMEAIAGMAKGNFTMMDNLGVAINDTNLRYTHRKKDLESLKPHSRRSMPLCRCSLISRTMRQETMQRKTIPMSDSTGGQSADIHVTVDIDGDTVGETVARYNAVRNRRLNGRS